MAEIIKRELDAVKKAAAPTWALQQAKNNFSQLVRAAALEPQFVTVHGKPAVVVISLAAFEAAKPIAAPRMLTGADMLAEIRGACTGSEISDEEWDEIFPIHRAVDPPRFNINEWAN